MTLGFQTPKGPEEVVADRVILTLPFAVLRTLDTQNAGFDGLKQTAIKELGAGRNAKLQLQFKSRYWNERRVQRFVLRRPRLPEHLGGEPRPARHARHPRQLHGR